MSHCDLDVPVPRSKRWRWGLIIGVWAGSVGAGAVELQRYKSSAAPATMAPESWPASSRLARRVGKPTLVVLAHPRCPCTKATVHELNVLMNEVGAALTLHVLFVKPPSTGAGWEQTELWRAAAALPGAVLTTDDGGREAKLFNATNSGHAVLYDAAGRRVFSGGLTISRGHEGDNPGLSRVLSLVTQGRAESDRAPVFGCDLERPVPPASIESLAAGPVLEREPQP